MKFGIDQMKKWDCINVKNLIQQLIIMYSMMPLGILIVFIFGIFFGFFMSFCVKIIKVVEK